MHGKGLLGLFGLGVLFGTNVLVGCGGADPAPAPSPAPPAAGAPADAPPPTAETPAPVGDPTPAPPPAPAPAPAKLAPELLGSRLALWLRADQGVDAAADNVTTWKDQSGNGNDATSMGMPPVTIAAAGLGGKPTIHFPGSTAYLNVPDSASLHFGTDDLTSFVVFAHASNLAPSSRIVLCKTDTAYPYTGFGFYANINNTYGLGTAVQYPTPVVTLPSADAATFGQMRPMLVVSRRVSGDELQLATGAMANTGSALVNQAPLDLTNAAALRIGGQGGSGQALTGDVAEIVVVHGTMTSGEVTDMTSYLSTKYGL